MSKSSTIKTLKRVEQLIQRSNQWTQGRYIEKRDGRNCFCLVGALNKAEGQYPEGRMHLHSSMAAKALIKTADVFSVSGLISFNDNHKHSEVLKLVRDTIKRLSK